MSIRRAYSLRHRPAQGRPVLKPRASGGMETAPASVLASLAGQIRELQRDFEEKLSRDAFKQGQIDRLHEEVQAYKGGLLLKLQRPYVMGLIQMHDSLGRVMEHLEKTPDKALTTPETVALLRGFQEDVEMLMEQNAILPFRESGDTFAPSRQTSLQAVPAPEPGLAGRIARRVRPGFEQEQVVLRKERVCVYASAAHETANSGTSPSKWQDEI